MRTLTTMLSACLLFGVAAQANAAEIHTQRTHGVSYSDLDLNQEADRQELQARVSRVVKSVCKAPYDNGLSLGPRTEYRRCVEKTKAEVLASIDVAQLQHQTSAIRTDHVSTAPSDTAFNATERVVQLSWRNHDLSQDTTLRTLNTHIAHAAKTACASPTDTGAGLANVRDKRACEANAKQEAYQATGHAERFAALNNTTPVASTTTQTASSEDGSLWDWLVTVLK